MKNYKKQPEEFEKFDLANAASPTECTGLIQQIPESDDEFDSYHEIYNYGPRPDNAGEN